MLSILRKIIDKLPINESEKAELHEAVNELAANEAVTTPDSEEKGK